MEEQERGMYHHPHHHHHHCGTPGPKPMVVNQIVGIGETQKSLDIHVRVPRRKPAIEQIVDVFIKRPCITHVEVLTGRVIVRGYFEAKTVYVACMPSQPVHGLEARHIRFTAEVPICDARCGMDADASVFVEYVDYECDHSCRAHWHKQWERYYREQERHYKQPKYFKDDCGCDDKPPKKYPPHKHHDCFDDDYCDDKPPKKHPSHKHHDCFDDDYDDCDDNNYEHHKKHHDCDEDYGHGHHHHHQDDCHCPPKKKPRKCCREFDISIVLRVTAKVMTCREIMLFPQVPMPPQYPLLPHKPKG